MTSVSGAHGCDRARVSPAAKRPGHRFEARFVKSSRGLRTLEPPIWRKKSAVSLNSIFKKIQKILNFMTVSQWQLCLLKIWTMRSRSKEVSKYQRVQKLWLSLGKTFVKSWLRPTKPFNLWLKVWCSGELARLSRKLATVDLLLAGVNVMIITVGDFSHIFGWKIFYRFCARKQILTRAGICSVVEWSFKNVKMHNKQLVLFFFIWKYWIF
jgi:hypothetical protein